MEKRTSPHLALAKNYWEKHLLPTDLAIDATCGNGHDTYFLSTLCQVIGLDIQQKALDNTAKRLNKPVALHLLSHEFIDTLKVTPKLIVYNLGYLPTADKSITTLLKSTLESVKKGLMMLAPEGALCITCYPGHDEGLIEETALIEWATRLCPKAWSVCHHKWLNRPRSPSLLWIHNTASQTSPSLPKSNPM